MYLRTIGRRFTQMIAYFLVMNSKRCNTNSFVHLHFKDYPLWNHIYYTELRLPMRHLLFSAHLQHVFFEKRKTTTTGWSSFAVLTSVGRSSGLMGRGSSAFKKTLCKLHDYKDYTGNSSLQCNNCDRVRGTFSFAIVTTLYKYISASFLLDVWGKWTTLSTSGFYTARTPQLKDANVHNNGQIYLLKKLNAGIDVISPLYFILISKHFINYNDPSPSKYTEKLSVTKLT